MITPIITIALIISLGDVIIMEDIIVMDYTIMVSDALDEGIITHEAIDMTMVDIMEPTRKNVDIIKEKENIHVLMLLYIERILENMIAKENVKETKDFSSEYVLIASF